MITPDDVQDCQDIINQLEDVVIKNMSLVSPAEASFIIVALGSKISFDHAYDYSDAADLIEKACAIGKKWSDGTLEEVE